MKYSIQNISSLKNERLILKPTFHLNNGRQLILNFIAKGGTCKPLHSCVSEVFTGGIFKRIFLDKTDKIIPYVTAQYMTHIAPLRVAKSISKMHTPRQGDMMLKENQILVSCAGTVGKVRIVTSDLTSAIGSQDIIRVICNDTSLPYGFIYAYLCTSISYEYIQSFVYGSVVPRIDPFGLGKLPVPIINDSDIQKCHNLIKETMRLRVSANALLQKAILIIENRLPQLSLQKIYVAGVASILSGRKRFDARRQTVNISQYYESLSVSSSLMTIEELSGEVFTPGIFKRLRVDNPEMGIPFIGGANLLEVRPPLKDYLSKSMNKIDDYILKQGWIAIQDSGSDSSMGYVSLVPQYLDNVSATNNLVRIKPSEKINYNPYIFAYLRSYPAQKILKCLSYGTGQVHIDTSQIKNLQVPIFDDVLIEVSDLVSNYQLQLDSAYKLEQQAISLIEKEIESWQ